MRLTPNFKSTCSLKQHDNKMKHLTCKQTRLGFEHFKDWYIMITIIIIIKVVLSYFNS